MRIFENKWFAKFARKEEIGDSKLIAAVIEIDNGNFDVDYGGGVYKQRISREGEGKSGGYRTIIIFRRGEKAFFVYCFAKNDLENIDRSDIKSFKHLAKLLLSLSDDALEKALANGEMIEVSYEKD